jgi:hypothetical protein
MRAVKGNLGHSPKECKENWKAALNARSGDSFKPFWNNMLGSLAAALSAERRVLARRGWAGEKVAFLSILRVYRICV